MPHALTEVAGERSETVHVRVTPEEKAAILARAREAGLSLSEFARRALAEFEPPLDNRLDEVHHRLAVIEAALGL